MTINEVKATLRAGIEAIEHGRSTFEQAATDAAEAIARAHQLLQDSQDGEVKKMRKSLTAAEGEVKATVGRFAAAKGNAESYLADLG
ncbi:hypothetical protein I0C86_01565 [Plantactinospora sp. S1510]|uniref:Uncharacterized protein n=1 Tax=Plantactinospora alkalitolerans TaxID=2789879 RepID=A0ABS0GNT2_9ACTN|nr:hypothetical protein [Plantactinospora alkalitolerans]MBF9127689.1 hypothetical protein [Plantactinospora alkalitolerans]